MLILLLWEICQQIQLDFNLIILLKLLFGYILVFKITFAIQIQLPLIHNVLHVVGKKAQLAH